MRRENAKDAALWLCPRSSTSERTMNEEAKRKHNGWGRARRTKRLASFDSVR